MKVLILSPSYPRHEKDTRVPFVRAFVKEMAKHCEVTVITSSAPEAREFSQVMDNAKIYRFRYFFPQAMQRLSYTNTSGILESYRSSFLAKLQMPLFLISFFFKSLKYAKSADVIHAQWMPSGLVGIFLKKIYNKPLICEVRGAERSMPKWLARYIAKRVDVFIAWTPELNDFLHSLGRKNGIEDIKGMIDFDKLDEKPNVMGFKKQFGLVNKRVVTFLGRLVYMKTPLGFVRAMPYVIEKRKDVRFLIVGDGELRDATNKLISDLNLNDYAIMTGARDDINNILNCSDIFVGLSPICHTYSATIMEAMYLGVPCILDTPKYTKENFIHKKYAYLVPNEDPKSLGDAILHLLENKKLHDKLSKNGHVFVKKLGFEKGVIVKKTLGLYKRLII